MRRAALQTAAPQPDWLRSSEDAIPAHTHTPSGRKRTGESAHSCVRVHAHMSYVSHTCERRGLVCAGCGKKKFGFLREGSYCLCLGLLIYALVKEISHLSLFISFLSLSLALNEIQILPKSCFQRSKQEERIGNEKRKAATRKPVDFSDWSKHVKLTACQSGYVVLNIHWCWRGSIMHFVCSKDTCHQAVYTFCLWIIQKNLRYGLISAGLWFEVYCGNRRNSIGSQSSLQRCLNISGHRDTCTQVYC